jgi:hypothetical protein
MYGESVSKSPRRLIANSAFVRASSREVSEGWRLEVLHVGVVQVLEQTFPTYGYGLKILLVPGISRIHRNEGGG